MATITDKIINLLRKAALDKSEIIPLCQPDTLFYKGKKKGYIKCFSCYPNQPERSKREDSQKCEMRCSEHCGNTVRDK